MSMNSAQEMMTKIPIKLLLDSSLRAALAVFHRSGIECLPVFKNEKDAQGVLKRDDFTKALLSFRDESYSSIQLSHLIDFLEPAEIVLETASYLEVMQKLLGENVSLLVVVDALGDPRGTIGHKEILTRFAVREL